MTTKRSCNTKLLKLYNAVLIESPFTSYALSALLLDYPPHPVLRQSLLACLLAHRSRKHLQDYLLIKWKALIDDLGTFILQR